MRQISRRTLLSTAATAAALATTRCSEPPPAQAPGVPTPSRSEQFVGKFVEDMGAGLERVSATSVTGWQDVPDN
jgi:hypothetical protein